MVKLKLICITAALSIALTASVTLFFLRPSSPNDIQILSTSYSPDGNHKMEIFTNDFPQYSFGPQAITIKIDDSNSKISTLIFNDGKKLSKEMCPVSWSGNSATIMLLGEEQISEVYTINFKSTEEFQILVTKAWTVG